MRMKDGTGRKPTLKDCLAETDAVAAAVVADLLAKTGTAPHEVDAVITSCSCFAPTPSMAAMIVNKFKMRKDCQTYSLAGMGCAASVLCADMAARLLASMPPHSKVLIFNHENVTANWTAETRGSSIEYFLVFPTPPKNLPSPPGTRATSATCSSSTASSARAARRC